MPETYRVSIVKQILNEIQDKSESEQITILESWISKLTVASILVLKDEIQTSLTSVFQKNVQEAQGDQ